MYICGTAESFFRGEERKVKAELKESERDAGSRKTRERV